jgi:hypothetical protein
VVGIAGPLFMWGRLERASPVLLLLALGSLVVLALFGLGARASERPALYAAGKVARTALLTIAVGAALAMLLGAAAVVLVFVACVAGGP